MKLEKALKISVGFFLTCFVLILGILILFGLTDTLSNISFPMFKTLLFSFILIVFGIILLLSWQKIDGNTEKVLILAATILFSASLAYFLGNFKMAYDSEQLIKNENLLNIDSQSQYYLQYAQIMKERINSLKTNNDLLKTEIANAENNIKNRKPIVIENIIKIPGKVIYVQEPGKYENEEEEEREDD